MWERDELWRRDSFGDDDKIPTWNRDKCGNAMESHLRQSFKMEKRLLRGSQ